MFEIDSSLNQTIQKHMVFISSVAYITDPQYIQHMLRNAISMHLFIFIITLENFKVSSHNRAKLSLEFDMMMWPFGWKEFKPEQFVVNSFIST